MLIFSLKAYNKYNCPCIKVWVDPGDHAVVQYGKYNSDSNPRFLCHYILKEEKEEEEKEEEEEEGEGEDGWGI